MLVQVVDVFEHGTPAADTDVVERAEVLGVFREADAAAVGDDGDVESATIGVVSGDCGEGIGQEKKKKMVMGWRGRSGSGKKAYFLAINSTARTSLTPPILHASIWQTSMAPEARNCLNMTLFWHISPVATPMPSGARAVRMALWPRMSSGEVGSSMNHGLNSARCCM